MTNLSDRNDWENVDTLGKLLDSTLPSAKEFIGNFDDLLKFLKEKGCNILPASKNATGTRMLEIGSGKGHFVTAMKKRGYDILGIDLVTTNPDGTPRAPADAGIIMADAADLRGTAGAHADKFPDQRYDIVFADHSFALHEYGEKRFKMANEVHRVLKDGGFFVAAFYKIPPPQTKFPSLAKTWVLKTINGQQIIVLQK